MFRTLSSVRRKDLLLRTIVCPDSLVNPLGKKPLGKKTSVLVPYVTSLGEGYRADQVFIPSR